MNSFNELAIQSVTYYLNIEFNTDTENLHPYEIQNNFEKAIKSKIQSTNIYNNDDVNIIDDDSFINNHIITNLPFNHKYLPSGTIFDNFTKVKDRTPNYFKVPAKNKHFLYDKEKPSVYELKADNNLPFDTSLLNIPKNMSVLLSNNNNNNNNPKHFYDLIDFALSPSSFENKYRQLIVDIDLEHIQYENTMNKISLFQKYWEKNQNIFQRRDDIKTDLTNRKKNKQTTKDDVILAFLIQLDELDENKYNNVSEQTLLKIIEKIEQIINEKMKS